jgi:hypothetical protein
MHVGPGHVAGAAVTDNLSSQANLTGCNGLAFGELNVVIIQIAIAAITIAARNFFTIAHIIALPLTDDLIIRR